MLDFGPGVEKNPPPPFPSSGNYLHNLGPPGSSIQSPLTGLQWTPAFPMILSVSLNLSTRISALHL